MKKKSQNQSDKRDTALLKLLPILSFEGWSDQAVKDAAENDEDIKAANFKDALEVCLYMSDWADRRMTEKVQAMKDFEGLKIREKIFTGVKTRLDVLLPHKEAVKASAAFMLKSPLRGAQLPKMIWRSADQIWWLAGDRATDYNHYSKRSLLSGVMSSTMAYWLKDTSEHHERTEAFLEDRISNVLQFGKAVSKIKKAGKNLFRKKQENEWG